MYLKEKAMKMNSGNGIEFMANKKKGEMMELYDRVCTIRNYDFIKGEEFFLLTGFGINGVTLLHIGLYQLVTPPCQPHVLGLHVTIIRTSEIQVLEGEKLILRCHGR